MSEINLNGRRVKTARIHAIVHIPDVGQLEATIHADSKRTNGVREMTKVQEGLYVTGNGPKGVFEAFIPNGNLVSVVFDNQETPNSVKK